LIQSFFHVLGNSSLLVQLRFVGFLIQLTCLSLMIYTLFQGLGKVDKFAGADFKTALQNLIDSTSNMVPAAVKQGKEL